MNIEEIKATLEFYANGWIQKPSTVRKREDGNQIYIEEVWRNSLVQLDHGSRARELLEKLND